MFFNYICHLQVLTISPLPLPVYLVQEQHYFMETVQLRGLKYDPVLQDESSGFSIVLSSVLKTKVRADRRHSECQICPSLCFTLDFHFLTG